MESASVLIRGVAVKCVCAITCALVLFFASVPVTFTQTFAHEVQARLSRGEASTAENDDPIVSAQLRLAVGDYAQVISGRVIFRKMILNAESAATGWFVIYDEDDNTIFDGRWVAMSFRKGETHISLEGRGEGQFTARKLKLKLKASAQAVKNEAFLLSGAGNGEIR